jgi:hypothetical protein
MTEPVENPTKKMSNTRYERFLNVYKDSDDMLFYNLLRSIVVLPAEDSSVEDEYIVRPKDTWILISYKYYDDMNLWWLVCEYNQVKNPTELPKVGSKLKLLKPEFINSILTELNRQIKS